MKTTKKLDQSRGLSRRPIFSCKDLIGAQKEIFLTRCYLSFSFHAASEQTGTRATFVEITYLNLAIFFCCTDNFKSLYLINFVHKLWRSRHENPTISESYSSINFKERNHLIAKNIMTLRKHLQNGFQVPRRLGILLE